MKIRRLFKTQQILIECLACARAFQAALVVKNPPANAGDMGSIAGSGRSPGGGNGNLLQYSCLGNPRDRGALAGYSLWGSERVGNDLVTKIKNLYLIYKNGSLNLIINPIH